MVSPFCSTQLCYQTNLPCVLFCSTLHYSILFYLSQFYVALFCSVLFYLSALFYSALSCCILLRFTVLFVRSSTRVAQRSHAPAARFRRRRAWFGVGVRTRRQRSRRSSARQEPAHGCTHTAGGTEEETSEFWRRATTVFSKHRTRNRLTVGETPQRGYIVVAACFGVVQLVRA